jgi:acetate kinase
MPELPLLAVNFGSSSLKTALYAGSAGDQKRLAKAQIARLRDRTLVVEWEGGRKETQVGDDPLLGIIDVLAEQGLPLPEVVGHRFVHGGDYDGPRLLSEDVLKELTRLIAWAPQHQPAALGGVAEIGKRWADVIQVGCFDSAFHRTMPEVAQRLPLPRELWDAGIRRYGFHGLSCQHVVDLLGAEKLGRAVVAHLGNGCSMTAIAGGKSVDTTMGFTPDAGLFMGSRSGDLDPGLALFLLTRDEHALSAAELRTLLQEQSGLRALSGGESDMAALLQRSDPDARLALDAFCRQIAKQVGAYATVLGGLDTLVFTGGIGEHADRVRESVVNRLNCLPIGAIRVVAADEESVIARQTASVLAA